MKTVTLQWIWENFSEVVLVNELKEDCHIMETCNPAAANVVAESLGIIIDMGGETYVPRPKKLTACKDCKANDYACMSTEIRIFDPLEGKYATPQSLGGIGREFSNKDGHCKGFEPKCE